MSKVLMHICCAPCAIYPLQQLRLMGYDVAGVYINPNIQPYKEYVRRLEGVKRLADDENLELLPSGKYDLEQFLRHVATHVAQRCNYCYSSRMEAVAIRAAESGIDCFTTSLLASPYQNHAMIRDAAQAAAAGHGLKFVYYDFRLGWSEGIRLAKEREYYRQPYCGCIYSEKERYCKE